MIAAWRLYLLLSVILFTEAFALASEIRPLYRSTRIQAMGGAYVALADDESILFKNPAALAGYKRYEVHLFTLDVEGSGDFISGYQGLQGITGGNLASQGSSLVGNNYYVRGQMTPMLIMPNFAFGMIVDGQAALYAQNLAFPKFTIGYQNTNGIQFAYGMSIHSRKWTRRRPDLRFGIGAKLLWRRGGYYDYTTITLLNSSASLTSPGNLVGNYEMGVGADLGVMYVHPIHRQLTVNVASAFTEIGDINFGAPAAPQFGNFSAGAAVLYEPGILDLKLAYEYAQILNDLDWRKRNHLGLEIGIPMVSLYAGVNQVYFTYGAGVNLWMLKIFAASYAEELGALAHQFPNRRYMVRLDLKLNI